MTKPTEHTGQNPDKNRPKTGHNRPKAGQNTKETRKKIHSPSSLSNPSLTKPPTGHAPLPEPKKPPEPVRLQRRSRRIVTPNRAAERQVPTIGERKADMVQKGKGKPDLERGLVPPLPPPKGCATHGGGGEGGAAMVGL